MDTTNNIKIIELGKGEEVENIYLTLDLIPIHVKLYYDLKSVMMPSIDIDEKDGNHIEYYESFITPRTIYELYTLENYQKLIDKICDVLELEKRNVFTERHSCRFDPINFDTLDEYHFSGGYGRRYYTPIKLDKVSDNWENIDKYNNDLKYDSSDDEITRQLKDVLQHMHYQGINSPPLQAHNISSKILNKYFKNGINTFNKIECDVFKVQTFIIGEGYKSKELYLTLDLIPIHLHICYNDETHICGDLLKIINGDFKLENYQKLINLLCDYLGLERRKLHCKHKLPHFDFKIDKEFYEYQCYNNKSKYYYTKTNWKNIIRYYNIIKNRKQSGVSSDVYSHIRFRYYHILFNDIKRQKLFTRNDYSDLSKSTTIKFNRYHKQEKKLGIQ